MIVCARKRDIPRRVLARERREIPRLVMRGTFLSIGLNGSDAARLAAKIAAKKAAAEANGGDNAGKKKAKK